MACKIHGLKNCPFPSCFGTSPLCDAHLMENCHVCALPSNALAASPSLPTEPIAVRPTAPPTPPLEPTISDPKAAQILAAAETYAQARQDVATITENVTSLTKNLQAAKAKLAEAKAAVSETKQRLAELMKKGDE